MFPRLLTIPAFDAFGHGPYGPFHVHTYGVLLAVAFLAGLWVASRQARREKVDVPDYPGKVTDMAVWVLIAGLAGAKLLLVAIDWKEYASRPRELLSIFQSGGVFYGGLLAGIAVAWLYARGQHLPGWRTADVLAPGVVIGQAIGRLGCFAAGCCWGKPTDVPWAVIFRDPYAATAVGTPLGAPVHPSQLYESAGAFLILAVLLWMSGRKRFHGQVALAYVGLYSALRFVLEFWRGDLERGLWFGRTVSTSQLVAIGLLLGVAFLLPAVKRRNPVAAGNASSPVATASAA